MQPMTIRTGRLYVLLVGALLAAAVFVRYLDPFVVQALRLIAFDTYQRLAPERYDPELPVRIVDIDEASLAVIGQWPWPRTIMRDLVVKLGKMGAAVVAFDFKFGEPDRTSLEEVVKRLPAEQAATLAASIAGATTNDRAFAAALKQVPSVLAVTLTGGPQPLVMKQKAGVAVAGDDPRRFIANFTSGFGNLDLLDDAAAGLGSINWIPDRDLVLRRVALIYRSGDTFVPTLAAEALRVAQNASTYVLKASNASGETAFGRASGLNHIRIGELEIPTDADGGIWLKFRPSRPEAFISAAKLLAGEVSREEIAGRIILIGTSAPGLLDLRATPLDAAVPGVEIIALTIEHLIAGRSLTRPDYALAAEQFAILLIGFVLAVVLVRVSARAAALVGGLAIAGIFLGGWAAYQYQGLLFDPLYPALAILCLLAIMTFYVYRRVELQRGEIRRAFSRYVAPAVVDELIANPAKLELGGEVRELTLMFCDVRNFTTISERLSAAELTRFINELLTPLSEIVLKHRGTIDKYIGDAIMAFWNAPVDEPQHAAQACRSALEIAARMDELNRQWSERAAKSGKSHDPVRVGIGINTGNCCVGNLGSRQRFDYSAIGDEVNVASRFEGLTKVYGLTAIVGARTIEESHEFAALELDRVRVKGRAQPVPIFTLASLVDGQGGRIERLTAAHRKFLDAYRGQQWDAAEALIAEARALGVKPVEHYYSLFSSRIAAFRQAPPPRDWDGAYTALEK
jgi:adenylate cyclase